ncbi:hypothetical protein BX261_6706 [Streptomyces sp. 2321.6]|nr:hypothetical protein BX261_6706 [Streptomyces sp. 2321.6]
MILSISGVVLLGVIVFLFFRKDGLKLSHALVSALFGFYLASSAIAPSIKAGGASLASLLGGSRSRSCPHSPVVRRPESSSVVPALFRSRHPRSGVVLRCHSTGPARTDRTTSRPGGSVCSTLPARPAHRAAPRAPHDHRHEQQETMWPVDPCPAS